ncbi:MAG: OmpH family outer membrane protein [Acidobacteriaceae bacterium]|nr:OmpH family outer membrane protein [Acidobacteriaceae bacterium]
MLRGFRLAILIAAAAFAAFSQTKVGVINSQQAVFGTAEFKKWRADEETKLKPRQDQLMRLQKEIQDIQTQLQSGKLSPQGEAELNSQAQRKQREGQRLQQDYQEDLDREQNEALQKIGTRMRELVGKLADSKGLDVVVDAGNTVFFKPALDLTTDAIGAYDKAYPVK